MTGQRWYRIDPMTAKIESYVQNPYEITEYYEQSGYHRTLAAASWDAEYKQTILLARMMAKSQEWPENIKEIQQTLQSYRSSNEFGDNDKN